MEEGHARHGFVREEKSQLAGSRDWLQISVKTRTLCKNRKECGTQSYFRAVIVSKLNQRFSVPPARFFCPGHPP
jgi:hypothetical protein